jgi:hypothetical protein
MATSGFQKLFDNFTNGFQKNQPKLESVFKGTVLEKIFFHISGTMKLKKM